MTASSLAGAFTRGQEGAQLAQGFAARAEQELGEAKVQDAVQHDVKPAQSVSWMAARRGRR